jgi:putative transposase
VKYAWIVRQSAKHSVRALCRALCVSTSGFYSWQGRKPSPRAIDNRRLAQLMRHVHLECREAYGARRLWLELRARGELCGRHRVARLRQALGLVTKRRKRFLRARNPYERSPPAPRRIKWPFQAKQPNRVWVADITFIPTRGSQIYLAVVPDLYARRVVGWAMSERLQQDLASSALSMAIEHRRPEPGLIHHSDRGSQYTSRAYRAQLEAAGITASMSRVAMPYDNAAVESFFSSLKNELTHHEQWPTNDAARARVFDYIEVFYNRRRLHGSLGFRSPVDFEAAVVA